MYQKFFDTDAARQDKIITAATKEFALYGYDNASTNRIVAGSDISKGILFHYFGNKKNLFDFIADYCNLVLTGDYFDKINTEETDFFVLLRQILELRFHLTELYPYVFLFFDKLKDDDCPDIAPFVKELNVQLAKNSYENIFKKCNSTVFAAGTEYTDILKHTEWVVEGLITYCKDLSLSAKNAELECFLVSYKKSLSIG